VWPVLRAALLPWLPELSTLTRKETAALIGVAPFNLTAGQCAAGVRLAGARPAPARAVVRD
jgi:hypothetical protein